MTKTSHTTLLTVILLSMFSVLNARPRIGIVLSGGGAKGMAHIGALKVIESAGIPIDIIVGTSMGSIIGGLYSIGYTTEQLDSIVMAQDWGTLLSDKKSKASLNQLMREQHSKYILSVPFFEKPQDIISGGAIKGRNIGRMLWQLTEGYHDPIDFRTMPIPFACVSQDLVSGREVVHQSGVLPLAIRASMSLPGVFAPVALDDQLLIDGGIVNNYPVDVARKMGADIIIGVDVQDAMKTTKELQNNVLSQLSQLIDLQSKDRWQENIKNTNVYIKVNVKGYSTASFNTVAIDSLIDRGQQAATAKIEELKKIRASLSTNIITRTRPEPLYFTQKSSPTPLQASYLKILTGKAPQNSINLGIRFDNEELAALLFNTQISVGKKSNHLIGLSIRLGINTYGKLEYNYHLGKQWHFTSEYQYTYNDFNIYEKGKRICEINFNHHHGLIGFTRSWKNTSLKLGGTFQHYNYGSFLYRSENNELGNIKKENYLKFGGEYTVNTLNDAYFPTKGSSLKANYHYVIPLNHNKAFHTADIHWSSALSFNSRFTLIPRAEGRYITTQNTISEINTLGGQEVGKYFYQQIPFYGVGHSEVAHRALVIIGIEARQRIGGKHYVSGVFNFAANSNNWKHFFKNSFNDNDLLGYHIFGGAIKYDLRTFIGPIGITICFSDRAKTSGYIRAGFNF